VLPPTRALNPMSLCDPEVKREQDRSSFCASCCLASRAGPDGAPASVSEAGLRFLAIADVELDHLQDIFAGPRQRRRSGGTTKRPTSRVRRRSGSNRA